MAKRELTGLEKAAILIISLGPEISSGIMKQLSEADIEKLTYQIANTSTVDNEEKNLVIDEFLQMNEAQHYLLHGGVKYAREILEKTLGPAKANEIIRKLTDNSKIKPFALVRKADPKQLLNFISNEHPQTIALILSYLQPEQASAVLSGLPEDMQIDIARRIALMERTSPETVREVESVLEKRLSSLVEHDFTSVGGIATLVDILNRVDRGTEKAILESLEAEDQSLADEIRKRMFIFEDIINLDDTSIRRILREVDSKDLAMAIKGSSQDVAQRIYKNMSTRASEMLKEDIEFLGPIRLRDVEEAQQRIVQSIRRLDELGEIIISRGGEDALIV
ncbi:flagellar motor switch protein FliG [Bacillota bacterium LX-D]|nr:flagellar motor switch protein FliG [Bacillota bacterium LX-D]